MKKIILVLSAVIVPITFTIGQIITTVAGSAPPNNIQATAMGMEIYGTIADKHGNIYVSDGANSVVRKVNINTGVATIVAGIGNFGYSGDYGLATSAGLSSPASLALDTAGNLYIGDIYGYRIRKLNIKTGIITTVAGNGTYGSVGDGGLATSAEIGEEPGLGFDKNNNMYIADFSNNKVREVNAVTGIITTIAGTGTQGYNGDNIAATAAELNFPAGVCVDDSGNVFIAEQTNCRVREVSWRTGIITTIAGNGSFAYGGDGGPAVAAKLWAPLSVQLDTAGNIYIADWGNNRVRKITVSTGIITTVAGNGTAGHSGDGGPATSAELGDSYCVALDSLNNLYIVEGFNPAIGWNNWIRKVDAVTQNISTVVGNGGSNYTGDGMAATSAQLCSPSGLKVDASGNIYVADWGNNRIREINNSGIISTYAGNGNWGFKNDTFAVDAEFFAPYDLALDKAGNMYVDDEFNNQISKINLHDTMSDFAGNGYGAPYQGAYNGDGGHAKLAELYFPTGVAVDDSGSVFIADEDNNRVRKVNWKTGIITTIAGSGAAGYNGDNQKAITAKLNYPIEVAVDDSDNVYIADYGNSRIRKVTYATGMITTVAGTGIPGYGGDRGIATSAELAYPIGVALDVNDVLYICDASNNRIRTVDPVSHIINTIAGDGAPGFGGDGGLATVAELNYPANVTFDAAGNMYIADNENNRIRKVTNVVATKVNTIADQNIQIKVYPNPSNGVFTFQAKGEEVIAKSTIEVYNELGQQVYSETLNQLKTDNVINIASQPNGIYLYKIVAQDGSLVGQGKLVIQK